MEKPAETDFLSQVKKAKAETEQELKPFSLDELKQIVVPVPDDEKIGVREILSVTPIMQPSKTKNGEKFNRYMNQVVFEDTTGQRRVKQFKAAHFASFLSCFQRAKKEKKVLYFLPKKEEEGTDKRRFETREFSVE